MEYSQFFTDSLRIILQAFDEYLPKDYIATLRKKAEHVIRSDKSIYIEIFAYENNKRMKVEQWKFKPKGEPLPSHLQRSYSQEKSNDSDSELSFSSLNEPTFFKTLETIRKTIQPKLLLKRFERVKVVCEIKDNEQELIAFSNGNTFYFQVGEYQNQLFQVKLSMKYNYQDEVVALDMLQEKAKESQDGSDQFQLLIDESYENKLRKQAGKGIVKEIGKLMQPKVNANSELKVMNLFSPKVQQLNQVNNKPRENSHKQTATQTLIPSSQPKQHQRKMSEIITSTKNLSSKEQLSQTQKMLKFKREQEFLEIQKLFKNIDFTTVESTKLSAFLEYLL